MAIQSVGYDPSTGEMQLFAEPPPGSAVTIQVAQTAHGFAVKDVVRRTTGSGYAKASSAELGTVGVFMVSAVPSVDSFVLTLIGLVSGLTGISPGVFYYVSDVSPGALMTSAGTVPNPVFYGLTATSGFFCPWWPVVGGGGAGGVDPSALKKFGVI